MSFAEIANRPKVTLCTVGLIIDGLDDNEATHLRGMLAADIKVWPHVGEVSIQAALAEEGYGKVNDKAIRAHRRGACTCPKD